MKDKTLILKHLLIAVLIFPLMTNCSDEDEITDPTTSDTESDTETQELDAQTLMINNFIDENMSIYYFWNEEMPDLDPKKEEDSEEYFYKLLKEPDDKWSFITDDYEGLMNYFSGIQKSTGYSLMPMYLEQGSNQVIAFIEYVHRNSPASEAGLERGDMIYRIDGQIMTDQNYSDLLSRDIFDITLAEIQTNEDGDIEIIELPDEIPMVAEEINLHPVIESTIIDTLDHKIGYLAYSSFVSNYDTALVNTFSHFKSAGITDLVVDLRYNGGGSVSTAALIGDILVPPGNVGETFIEEVYNDLLTVAFKREPDYEPDDFLIKFEQNSNNLNIDKFYVLTTPSTASASEMVIYGLEPYMDVIQIGETTHGKYYASATFWDREEKKHNWAIQPIILRSINATNSIDYSKGLPPDHILDDLFYLMPNKYQLGDPDELFMAKAISLITGEPFIYEDFVNGLKSASPKPVESYRLRNNLYPGRSRMWIDKPGWMK
jgi:C-terminal processing protease CtpA/Prc